MSSAEPPPLTDADWALRTEVYRSFADACRAPTYAEIASALRTTETEVRAGIDRLYAHHQIAPLADGSGVWMANPFSAVETDFEVELPNGRVWANCAWDAIGVPAILGCDARIPMRCAESGTLMEASVRGGRLEGASGVIHLVTPIRNAWDDIGFT